MTIPRTLAACIAAAAVLTACSATEAGPAEPTARPVPEQSVYLGPGQAAADRQLLDAVTDLAPWMLPQ